MSLIGGTTKGDWKSFSGEETGFTGEERAAAPSAAFGEWQEPFSRKQERDLVVPFLRHVPIGSISHCNILQIRKNFATFQ